MNLINKMCFFIRVTGKNIVPIERSIIDFYHLTIILKGNFTYIADGKEITLEENDALILIPGTDRYRFPHPQSADFVIFNFYPTKPNELKSNTVFKNAVNRPIKQLLDAYPYSYYHEREKGTSPDIDKTESIIHNLFNCILTELLDSLKNKSKNPHVINIIRYVNDNVTSQLTLNNVCSAVHLSKEYTARVFKKEMGMTVTEYINQQKLLLAKKMLLGSEQTLQGIAEHLGYQNYNYFSRIFKRYFGVSPLKLKNDIQKHKRSP